MQADVIRVIEGNLVQLKSFFLGRRGMPKCKCGANQDAIQQHAEVVLQHFSLEPFPEASCAGDRATRIDCPPVSVPRSWTPSMNSINWFLPLSRRKESF